MSNQSLAKHQNENKSNTDNSNNIHKQTMKNESIESICFPSNRKGPSIQKEQINQINVLSNTKDKSNTSNGSLSHISQYLNQNNLNYSTIHKKIPCPKDKDKTSNFVYEMICKSNANRIHSITNKINALNPPNELSMKDNKQAAFPIHNISEDDKMSCLCFKK